ncbi:hypothetical protein RKD41_000004 [Streptomyces tendae]
MAGGHSSGAESQLDGEGRLTGHPPPYSMVREVLGECRPSGWVLASCGAACTSRQPPTAPFLTRSAWDHPRGCGEQEARDICRRSARGPSPRVRGAVMRWRPYCGPFGTIPASAGSRTGPCLTSSSPGDHPRGCGEQESPERRFMLRAGPSPRVRGAGLAGPRLQLASGTIPAGAGSSRGRGSSSRSRRDHPRGCGEQGSRARGYNSPLGPSPRVRGAAGGAAAHHARAGTIPAGAGSRLSDMHVYR